MSPCGTPYDLILEKRWFPKDRRYLRNPVRWNLHQWRVAYKNLQPVGLGKMAILHNNGMFGHGRHSSVAQESFLVATAQATLLCGPGELFGGNHTETICQDVVNAARTEIGIKSQWINEANINLMLPNAWMSQDAACCDSDPNQRLLGSMQAKERRERREEEEPPPQRRRIS